MSSDAWAITSCADDDEDGWGDDAEVTEVQNVALELEIAPDADVDEAETARHVMIRIKVPEAEDTTTADSAPKLERTQSGKIERAAVDVCCVVDISGSMRNKATYEVDGVQRHDGLSYLDIVRHAVKAVIGILKAKDRFTLIAFDHHAEVAFPLDYMTTEGRARAAEALDRLAPRGRTDIWAGVLAGLESLQTPVDAMFRKGQRVIINRDSHFKGTIAIVLDPNFKDDTVQVRMLEGEEKGAVRSYFPSELTPQDSGWRHKSILLLTDGQVPVYHQPVEKFKAYKDSHPDFQFQLNTFGFGYDLDSQMLLDLAVEGQGTFAFIPDAVIVGTCFVNSVCNSLSTQTQNATIHLKPTGGASFLGSVLGVSGALSVDASWGRVVSLGPLQFGQNREVVVPMSIPAGDAPYLHATLVYRGRDGTECSVEGVGTSRKASFFARIASCRGYTIDAGCLAVDVCASAHALYATQAMHDAQQVLEELRSRIHSNFPGDIVPGFVADVDGRMIKALDGSDRFNRWGQHYLRALMRAHQLQVCTNFMDGGLQEYGGLLFRGLREEGDVVFKSLPAPRASAAPWIGNAPAAPAPARQQAAVRVASPPPRPPSPDMNVYYGGGGGG